MSNTDFAKSNKIANKRVKMGYRVPIGKGRSTVVLVLHKGKEKQMKYKNAEKFGLLKFIVSGKP